MRYTAFPWMLNLFAHPNQGLGRRIVWMHNEGSRKLVREGCPSGRKWMNQWLVCIFLLFQLLINGISWGLYMVISPLILTFDPSTSCFPSFCGTVGPMVPRSSWPPHLWPVPKWPTQPGPSWQAKCSTPRKINGWNIIMEVWKMIFLFNGVNFPGGDPN